MAKKKVKKKIKTKTQPKTKGKRPAVRPKKAKTARRKPVKRKPTAATATLPANTPATLPDIEVATTGGGRLRLSDLRGRNVILYFYPKDDTPGCTTESCDLRDRYTTLGEANATVLGVSRDSLDSHEQFKRKYNLPFELIADTDETLCRTFGVMREKTNYGRTYMGVERSTFIFDKAGNLRKEYRGVQVPGHADQVLEEVRKLF
jgi:peroxiredoxin Q/BCP